MKLRTIVEQIFTASVKSVNPECLVKGYADKIQAYYSVNNFRKMLVAGFGKAAYQMAAALEESIATELITDGVVVTKYGHVKDQRGENSTQNRDLKKIKVYEAAHPVPDENGIRAADEIIELLKSADQGTLVVCLISGVTLSFSWPNTHFFSLFLRLVSAKFCW